jgi:hypothetical protein
MSGRWGTPPRTKQGAKTRKASRGDEDAFWARFERGIHVIQRGIANEAAKRDQKGPLPVPVRPAAD